MVLSYFSLGRRRGARRTNADGVALPLGVRAAFESWVMKSDIHPKYMATKVTCGCGNTFVTRSTVAEMKVDICNVCHPFYTGKLKYIDTAGRIEKFQKKFAGGYSSLTKKPKKPVKVAPVDEAGEDQVES